MTSLIDSIWKHIEAVRLWWFEYRRMRNMYKLWKNLRIMLEEEDNR